MRNFSINYKDLDEKINIKSFPYKQVQHKLKKVAFDVVKFNDDAIDGLWKIEKSPDGEIIVALYDASFHKEAATNDWQIAADYSKNELSFIYKNEPIAKISMLDIGIEPKNIDNILSWLPNRISKNSNLRKYILKFANFELSNKFPELYEDK